MQGSWLIVLAVFVAACAACSKSSASTPPAPQVDGGAGDGAPPAPAIVTFPQTFMWGTSTAGFQVEKGDSHTDWSHWVAMTGKIKNADNPDVGGPDAFNHFDDDIQAMKAMGQNAYRFSIEWGRLYPTLAAFQADTPDAAGVAAYDMLLQKLKAAGIKPLVTLQHFTLPDWLDDVTMPSTPQGWEVKQTSDLFVEWCKRAAARWGAEVDWWVTLNEPLVAPVAGYLQGSFPPGVTLDVTRLINVVKAEAVVHTRCYDAVHAADTVDADGDGVAAWVSVAAHLRTFHPEDTTNADDAAATTHVEYVWNRWFLNVIVKGDWDDDLNGDLTGPSDRTADPTLKGRADYIGVNYYSDTLVSAHHGLVVPPPVNAAFVLDHMPTGRPRTDVAWDIYPEGFGTVLDEAATYGRPIVVTENGIADSADANRPRFLAEHLFQLGWAMQRGVDVRGYFHWATMDNFEWINGFCPKFGFYSVDPATGARTARPSAAEYKRFVAAGSVAKNDVDAEPPYVAPQSCP